MPYIQLEDIRKGMDRSKVSRVNSELGSAWTIKNAHLTRGGDIERRKSLVKLDDFPSTTKGLFAINDTLYTVGYDASQAGNVPSGVIHILTQHPAPLTSNALIKVLDAEPFDGKLYSISQFADGNIYHFYDTNRVTDWDSLSATIGSNNAVAAALETAIDNSAAVSALASSNTITITAAVAGTPFTISTQAINNGSINDQTLNAVTTQPNVAGVTEVVASADIEVTGGTSSAGINQITSITVDGVEILSSAVNWTTSNSNTASLLKTQIDAYTSSPEYDTQVTGSTLTIKAKPTTGATPNGFVVVVTVAGDVTVDADTVLSGGVTAVTAVAQIVTVTVGGTFEEADQFIVTINGTEIYTVTGAGSGTGTTAQTFKKKLYSVASSNLYFSALNAPTQWNSGIDPGFINMASETAGAETLVATAEYQGSMAVFSKNQIRIWNISEDSDENVPLQTLQNTGAIAQGSVIPYGNNDVFYLANSGIRSIKARDSSNAAYVSDVGTKIDSHVRDFINSLSESDIEAAVGIIEPVDGRYWLAIASDADKTTRISVLSFFPSNKISAWSYYDLDVKITHLVRVADRIYARATDEDGNDGLYIYGGLANNTYPVDGVDPVVIELPFLSAKNPAGFKDLSGFDILASNQWQVDLLPDINNMNVIVSQGITSQSTYGSPKFGVQGTGSLYGINLTCSKAGPATLSALALHYNSIFEPS
jgi:hypothetical protein